MCFIFLWSFDMYMWPQIDPFNASCWALVHIHRWLSRNTFFTQKVRTHYCEIHCHDLDFTKKLIHFSSLHKDAFWRDLIRWHIFSNRLVLKPAQCYILHLNAAKGVQAEFFLETKAKYMDWTKNYQNAPLCNLPFPSQFFFFISIIAWKSGRKY